MKAIILCAGYATRLYPLTQTKAKPLIEIKGKPIVEHIVDQLVTLPSIFKIQIVTNDKFHGDFLKWRSQYGYDGLIEILSNGSKNEDDKRGAVGDLIWAVEKDEELDDLLIIAGDNYFGFGLSYFVMHSGLQNHPVIAVCDVGSRKAASNYGIVDLNHDGFVSRFEEKPANPHGTLASIGLYYLPMDFLKILQEYNTQFLPMDPLGAFIRWLTQNLPVQAFPVLGHWYDIGDKEILNRLNTG